MTQTHRTFELAWIPPGTAAINPDQYVEHLEHRLGALRGILYGPSGFAKGAVGQGQSPPGQHQRHHAGDGLPTYAASPGKYDRLNKTAVPNFSNLPRRFKQPASDQKAARAAPYR